MKKQIKLIWPLIILLFCCGSVFADVETVKKVEEKKVIEYRNAGGRASYLKTIKTRFTQPESAIGVLRKDFFCVKSENIIWNKKLFDASTAGFKKVFQTELQKAHYPVPEEKDTIFDEPEEKDKKADLQVGIFIKQINANFCTESAEGKGGVYLKVMWQVYATEIQKVIFTATTEGSYQSDKNEKPGNFFNKAFAVAVRNFLAEPGFSQIVSSSSLAEKNKPVGDLIKIKGKSTADNKSKMDVTIVRSAVATIVNDKGSGSGFFLSQDGYLLSNYHVVGNSKFVKVKLATGRDLVGEVIRSDKVRDVALIKTEPISVMPIAIRKGDVNIGEDVYAIGSPMGHKFNTTLTKGILSGFRDTNGNKFLQSDVTILPGNSGGPLLDSNGNAIGITVSGMVVKGFSGMNFFIPIEDALAKLGVEIE